MTELTLIRHGQANSTAKDEASYDNLSERGQTQARLLGSYFQETGGFDRVISGAMRRQVQTAEGLNRDAKPHTVDARLNELDYFGLSQAVNDTHGVAFPDSAESFAAQIPQVLRIWRDDGVHDGIESFDHFRTRIHDAVFDAAKDGPAVLVTSTGVIATLVASALRLDIQTKSQMFLRIQNSSIHKFQIHGDQLFLTQFGATPHLDRPEHQQYKSHF